MILAAPWETSRALAAHTYAGAGVLKVPLPYKPIEGGGNPLL